MKNIILLALLVACGDKGEILTETIPQKEMKHPIKNKVLKQAVDKVEKDLGIDYKGTIRTKIPSDNYFNGNWLGVCDYKKNTIIIDLDDIEYHGTSVLLVVLHEIGHCHFGYKDREPKTDDDNCTVNIMRQLGKYSHCEKKYSRYLNQIKQGI